MNRLDILTELEKHHRVTSCPTELHDLVARYAQPVPITDGWNPSLNQKEMLEAFMNVIEKRITRAVVTTGRREGRTTALVRLCKWLIDAEYPYVVQVVVEGGKVLETFKRLLTEVCPRIRWTVNNHTAVGNVRIQVVNLRYVRIHGPPLGVNLMLIDCVYHTTFLFDVITMVENLAIPLIVMRASCCVDQVNLFT